MSGHLRVQCRSQAPRHSNTTRRRPQIRHPRPGNVKSELVDFGLLDCAKGSQGLFLGAVHPVRKILSAAVEVAQKKLAHGLFEGAPCDVQVPFELSL